MNKFILGFQNRISGSLYTSYINRDYAYFLNNETSQIVKNLTQEVSRVSQLLLMTITLVGEILIFIFIAILLLLISPKIFLLLIVGLMIVISIYYYFIKKKLSSWGSIISYSYNEFANNILQTFQNIKYVKLIDRNFFFINDFKKHYESYSAKVAKSKIISQTPKLWLEGCSVSIFFIIFHLEYSKNNMLDLLALLGVLVFALIKLLPSFNKIVTSYQYLLINQKALDSITELLFRKDTNKQPLQNKDHLEKPQIKNFQNLEFKNICFKYKDNKFNLKNISFKINKGDRFALIGISGSGKSTILDLLSGLLQPNSGEIIFNSNTILNNRHYLKSFSNYISYTCQLTNIFNDTLLFNITFKKTIENIEREKFLRILKIVELDQLAKDIANTSLGEMGAKLSGGQKQKIAIARSLYKNPEILILDEATSSLDNESEKRILKSVFFAYPELTYIMVTHKKNLVVDFNKTLLINDGEVKHYK